MENLVRRLFIAIAVVAVVLVAAGCSAGPVHPAASPSPLPPDPHTASALLKIRRWVFDLVLSNPGAVKLYRMPPQQYVATLGCAH